MTTVTPIRIDVYHHFVGGDVDTAILHTILEKVITVANELQTLTDKVAANTDVIESALTLISGFKAALDAAIAAGDPTKLQALSAQLDAEDQKLAAAVAANTPAAP